MATPLRVSRRRFLEAGVMSGAALMLTGCPCTTSPSIVAPSFWGYMDFPAGGNSLVPRRVYYPSWDRAPATATILKSCTTYPLIMFLHGQGSTYFSWVNLPAHLARAGFVVVVPETGGLPGWENNALIYPRAVLNWITARGSPFHGYIDGTSVGLCGHSYGATTAGSLAVEIGARAFASLAGAWDEAVGIPNYTLPLGALNAALFAVSDAASDIESSGFELGIHQELWDMVKRPKHHIKFWNAKHFDYLAEDPIVDKRGPCALVPELTAEVLVTFFSKYMVPAGSNGNPLESLIPPPVLLPAMADYVSAFSHAGNSCKVTLTWDTMSSDAITLNLG